MDPYARDLDDLRWRMRMEFALMPRTRRYADRYHEEAERAILAAHRSGAGRRFWAHTWRAMRAEFRAALAGDRTYTYSDPRQFTVLTGITS